MAKRMKFLVEVEINPGTVLYEDEVRNRIKEELEECSIDLYGFGDNGDKDFEVVEVSAINYPLNLNHAHS